MLAPEIVVGGADKIKQPQAVVLKYAIGKAVSQAPYNLELSRKWTNIGNKIDAAKDTALLEDEEYAILHQLVRAGLEKAFPTMETRLFADEVMRIIEEAEEYNSNKKG